MILQSLVKLYEELNEKKLIPGPGWATVKVSYAICLNDNGEIDEVISLKEEITRGKKTMLIPREMSVPVPVKRAVNIASNFLCDNSSYILGVDDKEKNAKNIDRTINCYKECCRLHWKILKKIDSKAAKAVSLFFEKWEPEKVADCVALHNCLDEIKSGANIVFRYNGIFVHDDPVIRTAWEMYYLSGEGKDSGICLVTGENTSLARLHPSIKGVAGAQSSGASLVSFNAASFCSYGKEQGMNAQTSEYAAFAYGAALNYLIADKEHTTYIGDTVVLCWASGADIAYQSAFCGFVFGKSEKYSESDLRSMLKSVSEGKEVIYDETKLDPHMEFYVLGIAPNAARLSVRFFMHNSFESIIKNVEKHFERLEITKPSFKTDDSLPVWKLLNETVNQNSREKSASPQLAGDLVRSILNNSIYPATLLNGVILRIRAEHRISYEKAAILKAYYLKNKNNDVPEEVLTVSLNRETNNTPYVLGRLFSILENIQETANPGINTTIKDKFFNSASATPSTVFPQLVNLAQKHLRKLDSGMRIYLEKQLGEVLRLLNEDFPARLNLPQQGAFQLGYYHQTQDRYTRNNKENK